MEKKLTALHTSLSLSRSWVTRAQATVFLVAVIIILLFNTSWLRADEISNVGAFYRWDANDGSNIFEVRGRASYPDGAWLFISLGYQGQIFESKRAIVKDKKFSVVFKVTKKILPTYYSIEIAFLSDRQNSNMLVKLKNLDEKRAETYVRVGDVERISKEREKTIALLRDALAHSKIFFDRFFLDFKECLSGIKKFNQQEWNLKYKDDLINFDDIQKTLTKRQETYYAVLVPEFELLLQQNLSELERLFNESMNSLISGKDIMDLHGRRIPQDEVFRNLDSRFDNLYNPMASLLELFEQIGDINFILSHLRILEGLYKETEENYQSALGEHTAVSPTNREKMSLESWRRYAADRIQTVTKNQKEIRDNLQDNLAKSFPDAFSKLISMFNSLTNLLNLCGNVVELQGILPSQSEEDAKISRKSLTQIVAKIADEQKTFKSAFYDVVSRLQFQRFIPDAMTDLESPVKAANIEEAPKFLSAEEQVKYIEAEVQKLTKAANDTGRDEIVRGIVSMGEASLPYLLKELFGGDKNIALAVLRGLFSFKELPPETIKELTKLLAKETDDNLKIMAISLLSGFGNKLVIKDLIKCGDEAKESKENSILILRTAILGLGTIGSSSDGAIEWLIEKLSNDDADTRSCAYSALVGIVKMFLDFDYQATPEVRARQVGVIRTWCEKNKDRLN